MLASLAIFLNYIASKPTSWKVLVFAAENRNDHDEVLDIFDDPELYRSEDRQDYMGKMYYQGLVLLYFP